MNERPEQNPPEKGSILKKAKEIEAGIYTFYDEHAGNVNLMLLTPWGKESTLAGQALRAEADEKQGEEPLASSEILWQKYEQKYGDLNAMIAKGEIVLELILDSVDKEELEVFIQGLRTELGLRLELISEEDEEQHFPNLGMNRMVNNRVYTVTVRN